MKRIILSLCLTCFAFFAMADMRVTLNDGTIVEGEVVVDNSEILIIKDIKGRRYQYPPSLVKSKEEIAAPVTEEEIIEKKRSKVGIMFGISEGVSFLPATADIPLTAGSTTSIDVLIGAKDLQDTHVFLGGGIGWNGYFHSTKATGLETKTNGNFIPLKIVTKIPLTQAIDAPAISAGLGYGFAAKKNSPVVRGGLFAEIGIGWNHSLAKNKSIYLGLHSTFQQCQMKMNTTVDEVTFEDRVGRCFSTLALRFSITL